MVQAQNAFNGDYGWLTSLVIIVFAMGFLFFLFYLSRYKKFKTNEYVIHFRNGRVKHAGTGGRVFKLPVFDEIVVIPTTVQQTTLEARERVVSHEYQDVSVTGLIYWRVDDPSRAFAKVSWIKGSPDYVETVIRTAAESIMRTACANMPVEDIIRDRAKIIKIVTSELHSLMHDWGIIVESIEILYVEVLDSTLKKNLEATKKIEEEEKARLRRSEMEEVTRLRDLEVQKKTGIQEQNVALEVQSIEKDREIKIERLEQNRAIIEAETNRKKVEIESNAMKIQKITQEVEVEAERIKKRADANKYAMEAEGAGEREKMIAEAEGTKAKLLAEADGAQAKLLAEAKGILEQAKAAEQVSDPLLMLRIIEQMPEIFGNIKVDKMMLLGKDGEEAYGSLAKSVIPLTLVFKELLSAFKEEKVLPTEKKKLK